MILRHVDAKNLLISGLLDGGDEMAERAAVVDACYGRGHVLLFTSNPIGAARPSAAIHWCSTTVNLNRLDVSLAKTSDATSR